MARCYSIIAMMGLGLAGGTAQAANLIKDGGFETPATTAGGFKAYTPGQKIGPWKVIGASGNVTTVSTSFVAAGVTLNAQAGTASADLTGTCDCGAPSGVAQTVPTIVGKTYKLTFWAANAYIPGHGTSTTIKATATMGGTEFPLLTSQSFGGAGTTTQAWDQFSATFVATATQTTISLISADPAGDYQSNIDTVSLVPL